MQNVRERHIEELLCREVQNIGGVAFKFVSPGIIGVPDRLVLIPGGIVSFVELKAPGKKPRSIQRVVMRRLYHMGARVVTIDNVMTVMRFVDLIRRRPWNFIRTSIRKS